MLVPGTQKAWKASARAATVREGVAGCEEPGDPVAYARGSDGTARRLPASAGACFGTNRPDAGRHSCLPHPTIRYRRRTPGSPEPGVLLLGLVLTTNASSLVARVR